MRRLQSKPQVAISIVNKDRPPFVCRWFCLCLIHDGVLNYQKKVSLNSQACFLVLLNSLHWWIWQCPTNHNNDHFLLPLKDKSSQIIHYQPINQTSSPFCSATLTPQFKIDRGIFVIWDVRSRLYP